MGTTETVLAKVEMRILTLLNRARIATPEDAANAANALLRQLFIVGSSIDLRRRTISRAQVLDALGVDDASLRGDLAWSQDTAAAYRAAVAEGSSQVRGFVPMNVVSAAAVPSVLRLMYEPDCSRDPQSLDAVLREQAAALVGATGEGSRRPCGTWPASQHSVDGSRSLLTRPATRLACCRGVCGTGSRRC